MSLPNNNGDEFVEEFTDQVQDRPQCLKRRFVEMLDCHDQSVDNMRDRADKALFRTTRRLGLFDKFARLNSAEKRRVRSAILDDVRIIVLCLPLQPVMECCESHSFL